MKVRTVDPLLNLFYKSPSTLLTVDVEEVLQCFMDNPQLDYMPVLQARQVHPWTETVFVGMSTFVSHLLAPHFLAGYQSPKAMLHLVVPAMVQQDLLLR